jgi:hypothetical protein
MERVNANDIGNDQLKLEIQRANAIANLAAQAISNAELALRVQLAFGQDIDVEGHIPMMLAAEKPEEPEETGKTKEPEQSSMTGNKITKPHMDFGTFKKPSKVG